MPNKTFDELTTTTNTQLADNTTQDITAPILRGVLTDYNDTCFRDDAIALEDSSGRILLEDEGGYIIQES